MTDYLEATERLHEQLAAYPDMLNPNFFGNPTMHRDAIALVTTLIAGKYVPAMGEATSGPATAAEYLEGWRDSLRDACSVEYRALQMEGPGDTQDIDQQPGLVVLNGLRLGVGQALRLARKRADARHYGQRWQHTPATMK